MAFYIKKSLLFFLLSFIGFQGVAQITEDKKYLLHSKVQTLSISSYTLTDPYLSPLPYSGLGIQFNSLNRRFLSITNNKFSRQTSFNNFTGLGLNAANTATEIYLAANWGYGIHYHYRPIKGLQLLTGGLWDMGLGVKTIARNVNNPANIDLATNLNISEIIQYDIPLKSRTLKLELAFQSPVVGCMFVPLQGASYYEMFAIGNLSGATHVSSLHNKLGLLTNLAVNVPFNNSVWRFGIKYDYLKYRANEMLFKRDVFTFCVGTTFDAIHFAGRKNNAPANFLSTNE